MSGRPYDSDPEKEEENLRTHRVGFADGFAVLTQDEARLWQFLDQPHLRHFKNASPDSTMT